MMEARRAIPNPRVLLDVQVCEHDHLNGSGR